MVIALVVSGCTSTSDTSSPSTKESANKQDSTAAHTPVNVPVKKHSPSTQIVDKTTQRSALQIKDSKEDKSTDTKKELEKKQKPIVEYANHSWNKDFKDGWVVVKKLNAKEYEITSEGESLLQIFEKEAEDNQLLEKLESLKSVSVGMRKGYEFVVNVPKEYSETSRSYPLIIFLHGGIGGKVSNNLWQLSNFSKSLSEPSILLAPVKVEIDWDPRKIKDVIDETNANLRINHNRIYLTGLSMGGRGTYIVASDLIDTFAAIMPLSSHHIPYSYLDLAPQLENLPIWIFHGDSDLVSSYPMAVEMAEALNAQSTYARFTTIVDGKHNGWNEIYSDPEVLNWLLAQERGTPHNYELNVDGGTGSGYYEPETGITIISNLKSSSGQSITWTIESAGEIHTQQGNQIEIFMPENDVSIFATLNNSDS